MSGSSISDPAEPTPIPPGSNDLVFGVDLTKPLRAGAREITGAVGSIARELRDSPPVSVLRELTSPPGKVSLVHPTRARLRHQGIHDLEEAVAQCALYRHGERVSGTLPLNKALAAAQATEDGFVWVGLRSPDESTLSAAAAAFGLHPRAAEEAASTHARPKLEIHGKNVFLALKTLRYNTDEENVDLGELLVMLDGDYIMTIRHDDNHDLSSVRSRLERLPEHLAQGPLAPLHAILDSVVDGYAPALDALAEDVDEVADAVFSATRNDPTERIYKLKREVLEAARAIDPLREITDRLSDENLALVPESLQFYFHDVHSNVLRASEQVAALAAMLSDALTANSTQVALRQNEDMRRISAWVAIAAVSTLIAGVYGMNFDHIPELHWAWGYPFALSLMGVSSTGLWVGFRRAGWI